MSPSDEQFMRLALEEARAAAQAGEVPVGAVIVMDGEVLARSGNRTTADCDPTAHAEIVALRAAARELGNWRLVKRASTENDAETQSRQRDTERAVGRGATIYVTIEPCAMCAGAMIQARVSRLVYGCDDPKGGAVRSCAKLFEQPGINHRVEVSAGILADECAAVLQRFFAARR